jgi:carboxymethylenebutenolidase
MCDEHSIEDMIEYNLRTRGVSRRQFSALTLGAGLASALPPVANAAETKESEVEIKTPDGTADAYFVHPATGKYPAVLVWPDIFGLRPAFRQMGKRLAESGYSVLVVNPFYRAKKAPVAPEHADFSDPATRQTLMGLHDALSPSTAQTDAKAFIPWLDKQAAVDTKRKVGTTGYCRGGPIGPPLPSPIVLARRPPSTVAAW